MSLFKNKLWILTFLLMTASYCSAAEVAMVTDGKATATLDDEIWSVELAEILPENVQLMVGSEQHLALIHLINNKEYQIPADSQVTILKEGIKDTEDNGKKIELVVIDSNLGDDMDDQTGAANLGRVFNPPSPRKSARPVAPPSPPEEQSSTVLMEKESYSADDYSPAFDKQRQETQVPNLMETKPEKLKRKQLKDSKYLVFAMPATLARNTGLVDMNKLGDANLEIFNKKQQNNWNIFYVKQLEPKSLDYTINLNELADFAPMSLVYLEPAKIDLANAIKLEKYKLYYQAAGAWFELANKNQISQRVLKQHLSRLNQLINNN